MHETDILYYILATIRQQTNLFWHNILMGKFKSQINIQTAIHIYLPEYSIVQ